VFIAISGLDGRGMNCGYIVREREREKERVDSEVTGDYPQSSTSLSRLCPSLTFLTGETLNLAWKFVGTCREENFYRMWIIGPAFDSKC
jgi:hypothetical protein